MNPGVDRSIEQAAALLKAGDILSARVILVEVLRKDIDHELAWYYLSHVVEEHEKKIYALRHVLRINPNNPRAKEKIQELEASIIAQVPSLSIEPVAKSDLDALLSKAKDLVQRGDYSQAREVLQKVLKGNPECGEAWYLYSQSGFKPTEEKVYLRQVLRIDPDHTGAVNRLNWLTAQPARSTALYLTEVVAPGSKWGGVKSLGKYTLKKSITLFATVVVGIYITILVANLGGYVDEIFRGMITQQLMGFVRAGGLDDIPADEKDATLEQMEWNMEEGMGLHDPFLLRSVRFLVNGLTLNFGETFSSYFFRGVFQGADQTVQQMVLERMPYTLLLVGLSNLLVFLVSIFAALFLSRKYGSWMDRISAALASLSSAPSWIFGIILIVLLAGQLRILPFPKVIDPQYADFSPRYIKLVLSQLVMPVMAIFLSVFFQGVYTWRTFFLIYSQEDYVEMAKAMGLPPRKIERQYILKPTFPYVITNFALMMITVWETSIALEVLFYWPGIGPLFLNAVNRFNTSLIVAIVVIFAYLMAITVFVLDLTYAVMDPRVRLGQNNNHLLAVRRKRSIVQHARSWITSAGDGVKSLGSGLVSLLGFWRVYRFETVKNIFKSLRSTFREIRRYPTAIAGLAIIIILIGVSIYTVIAIPYNQAVELWRTHTSNEGIGTWERYPRNASPAWVNLFRVNKLPETLILNSTDPKVVKTYEPVSEGTTDISISYVFDYPWGDFPEELSIFFDSKYQEKPPHISVLWLTPDGREIRLNSFSAEVGNIYRIAQDERLERKLSGLEPPVGLFADPEQQELVPVKGRYELRIEAIVFESGSDIDAEFILYGRVYGIAGTDNHRRDLKIPMLWGTPVALAFGLVGAIGTSLAAMFISAFGVWFGGWVDSLIQRITEVNIILPTLPVAIMIFIMYSKSIWAILGVIILLNIFGTAIKNYRAAFLQIKEAGYVEGAMAYGTKDGRIVLHYLIPRIVPVLLPQLVIMVPGYVFYEATLAYLGLSDPYLPTWGKVVHDAFTNGAHQGLYYWILEPIGLLLITGLAFALLGFALDRVINPRLREV